MLSTLIHHLFDLNYLLTTYGYVGIFIIVFLESGIFFALPGDSLLFTAGLLATGAGLRLPILIPLIFVATFLGGLAGYHIGINIKKLNGYKLFRKILNPEYIQKANHFFEKHGQPAVILSRFVPVVRTFVPIVAGITHMKYSLFIRYSIISSILWSVIVTLLGFFLGKAFPQIQDYVQYFIIGIIFVSFIPVVIEWIREHKAK